MTPLLGPDDPLPYRPRRILVAGTSGSGKTTVAGRVAATLRIPHIEIDALFHGPGWTPRETFEADVRRFAATETWVTEWQYSAARPLLLDRADLLLWLDLPRYRVMLQVTRRTLTRRRRREVLWNGNIEPPLLTFFTDPEHIIRWAWTTHHKTAARTAEARTTHPTLPVVRLRSRPEITRWLSGPLPKAE